MTLRPLFVDADSLGPLLEEGFTVLTPNRRLARAAHEAINRQQSDRGRSAWDSLQIMPLRQFAVECWQKAVTRGQLPARSLVEAPAQRHLWRRIIEEDSQSFSLLSPNRAALLCQEAFERLSLWEVDIGASAARQLFSFDEDSRAFVRWEKAFRLRLDVLSLLTPEQALEEFCALPGTLERPIALLHIESLPPLHARLCAKAPRCENRVPSTAAACLHRPVAFAELRSELAAIARWCRECASSDPEGRYGVVLADMGRDRELLELLLRREFDCLTQDYESLPVNFSTGFSLEAAPLVRDGLTLLALCAEQVAVEDLGLPFHSRFVTPLPLRRDRLEKFLQRLHELNRDRIPRAVFLQLAEGLLEQTDSAPWESAAQLDVRMHLSRRRRAPSQWLEPFAALLDIWGWPRGRALDSLEYQQLQHWQTALESYARLDPILGELSFEQALQSLRGHIAEQQFQPHTQDRAIQILGPLETTGLHFDALWISGMDASRWPSAPRPNPYLPHSIQRQQRMPHCDAPWEWEWARNRWELWRSSALQLHSSYVNQSDGAESARSPLLGDMDAEDSDSVYQVDPRWQQQGDSAVFVEPRLLAVPIQEQERASDGVSASALDQQSQCPFQAFAAQRLRVQAPSTTTAGLTPAERGTWLHSALFCLFADLPDSAALALDNAPAIAAAIERALQEAESGLGALRRDVLGTAIVALERRRLENLLKEWLDIERSRGEPFLVVRREWARELLIGPLRLRLRLDRVDRMADGSELVIDYKSGVADSPGRWFESPPRKLQLPLYALLEPPPAGISYASLKPGKLGFRGVGERSFTAGVDDISSHSPDGSGGAAGMNTVRAFWRAELSTLAEHFVAGENQVDPLVGACRYCGRQSLCRVGDGQQ